MIVIKQRACEGIVVGDSDIGLIRLAQFDWSRVDQVEIALEPDSIPALIEALKQTMEDKTNG
jgi:hypothetical protein